MHKHVHHIRQRLPGQGHAHRGRHLWVGLRGPAEAPQCPSRSWPSVAPRPICSLPAASGVLLKFAQHHSFSGALPVHTHVPIY